MLQNIKYKDLSVSDLNVRKSNKGKVKALSQNILAMREVHGGDGLIQPITVKKVGNKYQVVAGQRRLSAIGLINKKEIIIDEISCNVIDVNDGDAAQLSLSENVFQHQMGEFERYRAYQMLVNQGVAVAAIAKNFGSTVHKVRQSLALADLLPGFEKHYNTENLSSDALFHLTRYDHDQQQLILNELNKGDYFTSKYHIKDMIKVQTIDPEYALFDLESSGLAVVTDLFSDDRDIHDVAGFYQAQRDEVKKRINELKTKGELGLFYDIDETFDYDGCKKASDTCKDKFTLFSLQRNGEVKIIENLQLIAPEVNDGDEQPICDDSNQISPDDQVKVVRQEITKKAQTYYMDWHWVMARHTLMNNQDIAFRFMVASMITQTSITYNAAHMKSEDFPKDLFDSDVNNDVNRFLEVVLDEFEVGVCSYRKSKENQSFKDVFNRILGKSDNELKEIMVAIQMLILKNNTTLVHDIGTYFNVDVSSHFKLTENTIETFSSKGITSCIAQEVMNETDAIDFEKLTLKDRKVKLAEVLDENYLPKYIHFQPERYIPDAQKLDFEIESLNYSF